MRILVACEFSATLRDHLRKLGHDAYSADILPTEGDPEFHIQGDVREILDQGWEMMVAFPPCTYLTKSGVRWLWEQKGRVALMREGARFFMELLNAPIEKIAIENPVMHGYATDIIGRKQDQIIQPWMFGHLESKGTGLWLKNLPRLVPTNDVKAETMALTPKERDKVHWAAPGKDRWKVRSRTYAGIAEAMAQQWAGQA